MWSGTTPLVIAAGLAAYVAATDATEPLAQEIDHPTLTESMPLNAGTLMVRHLVEPCIVMICAGIAALAVAIAVTGEADVARIGAVTVLTASLCGVAGATISIVSSTDTGSGNDMLMTPEVAGPRLVFRTAWPPLVAIAGFLPALAASARDRWSRPPPRGRQRRGARGAPGRGHLRMGQVPQRHPCIDGRIHVRGDEPMSKRRRSRVSKPVIPAIACEGLVKEYGEVTALAEIDLEVPGGQTVVLVGHNGSGKSTFLNLLAGTLEPTDGIVQIHGSDPDSISARVQRSWMPDNPVLYDDLTVDEHLRYVARMHGGTGEEERIDELIDRLGLSERHEDLPVAVQPRVAPEDGDRRRHVQAVLGAAGGRTVRRTRRNRQSDDAGPARRGSRRRGHPRGRHP